MCFSILRANGSIDRSERPVSGLCFQLGRKTDAIDGKLIQARSMFSTPPLA